MSRWFPWKLLWTFRVRSSKFVGVRYRSSGSDCSVLNFCFRCQHTLEKHLFELKEIQYIITSTKPYGWTDRDTRCWLWPWVPPEPNKLKLLAFPRWWVWEPSVQCGDRPFRCLLPTWIEGSTEVFKYVYCIRLEPIDSFNFSPLSHFLSHVQSKSRFPVALNFVGPPDPVCVSYTHDRDFGNFKEQN
jgi:hypothetical protein